MTDNLIIPVVLCGGVGARLWPVSREKMPKHLVPLIGSLTTFQQVLDRVTRDDLFAAPIIITNSDFRFVVAEQTRARGVKATILLEPQRRDSAAAIGAVSEFGIRTLLSESYHLISDVDISARTSPC
jgi:mannose-1-phosphate guanylyltransferase / mannose-6-phosphate isomerase